MRGIRHWCAASVVLMAASTAAFGQSADKAVLDVLADMSQGNARAIWDAMPASYQQDISFLVHTGATKVDPVIYDKAFALARKIVDVMADKKQMILASPQVANTRPEKIKAAYDPVVEMLSLVVNSDISELAKLKNLDIGKFMAGTGSTIVKKGMALREQVGHGPKRLAALKDVKVTLVSAANGVATLNIEAPDKPAKTEAFVRIEGKWLPMKMVAAWAPKMAEAKAKVQTMEPKLDEAQKQQLVAMMDIVDTQLDTLAKTDDQEKFNMQLMTTQMSLVGMIAQVKGQHKPHERGHKGKHKGEHKQAG